MNVLFYKNITLEHENVYFNWLELEDIREYKYWLTGESRAVRIVVVSKRLDVVLVSLLFRLTVCKAKIHFLGWNVVNAVHLYITSIPQSPLSGNSVLMWQLNSNWWFRFICVTFLLCPLIIWDIFWVQL